MADKHDIIHWQTNMRVTWLSNMRVTYTFDLTPEYISIRGNFDNSCQLTISEECDIKLKNKQANLQIYQHGYGETHTDSHFATPIINASKEKLLKKEDDSFVHIQNIQ